MNKQTTIGVLLGLNVDYCRHVMEGISRYALQAGWHMVFQTTDDTEIHGDSSQWRKIKVDGLLIQVVGRATMELARSGSPAVNFSSVLPTAADIPTVSSDNDAVGRMAAEHLMLQPVSHFACFAEPHRYFSETRGQGFIQTLRQAGHTCSTLVSLSPRQIVEWVQQLPKPVGIFVSSDIHAAVLLNVCQAAGVEIRGRVAVVGVDNSSQVCEATFPRLSSVSLQSERIGWEAAAMLDRMMQAAAQGQRLRPDDVLIPPQSVVERESSVLHIIDAEMAEAMKLIRTNYHNIQSVEDLAERLSISRRTIERRFHQLLGHSPLEEILRVRIAAARQLLVQTHLSVAQIAGQCGFGSATRLGLVFRKMVGCTPTAYRQTMRGESPGQ